MCLECLAAPLRYVRSGVQSWLGHTIVLLYHRVADLPSDPQCLSVSPQRFVQHLEILRRHYYPVTLEKLQKLSQGVLPRKSVVLTFDDGYADNLYRAKPILECFDISATVFVVSGKIGKDSEFWWDDLEHIILEPDNLPDSLFLTIRGKTHLWQLEEIGKEAACVSKLHDKFHSEDGRWNVTVKTCPTPRQRAYRELTALLMDLDAECREEVLVQVAQWAGVSRKARLTHRILSADEVVKLSEGSLVEIGAHTVTHPVLASQPLERQRQEIMESKQRLETIVGRPVNAFSYPFGTRDDYTGETVAAVQQAGFTCACSNFGGRVQRGTDPFQLPRYLVRDWDGDEFARRLRNIQVG